MRDRSRTQEGQRPRPYRIDRTDPCLQVRDDLHGGLLALRVAQFLEECLELWMMLAWQIAVQIAFFVNETTLDHGFGPNREDGLPEDLGAVIIASGRLRQGLKRRLTRELTKVGADLPVLAGEQEA